MAETSSELLAEVEKLERKHAENPEGRFFVPLANAYRKLGQLEAAESLLREGLRRHPEYLSAHIVLGRCLADHGAVGDATEEFRYVLSLDPQNLIALRSLGELSLTSGHADEAGRWYRDLLTADPMNEEARRALESIHPSGAAGETSAPDAPLPDLPEPDYEPAADPLPEAAAARAETDDPYFLYGGYAETADGARPDAEDEVPLEEDEEDSPELVTETIAELYARQGFYGRAADVYRELIRRRGGDPGLQSRLAEVERMAAGPAPELAQPRQPAAEPTQPPESREDLLPLLEPGMPGASAEEDFFEASFDSFDVSLEDAEPWEPFGAVEAEDERPDLREEDAGPTIARFLADLAGWMPGAPESPEAAQSASPVAAPADPAPAAVPVHGTAHAGEEAFPWEFPEPPVDAPRPPHGGMPAEPEDEALFSYADFLAEPEPQAEPVVPEPSPPEPATPVSGAAEDDDDLESFQAWLRSLKR